MAASPPTEKDPCALASYVFPTSRGADGSSYIITTLDDGDNLTPPRILPDLRLVSPPADVLEYWDRRVSTRNQYDPLQTFDIPGPRIRPVIDGFKKLGFHKIFFEMPTQFLSEGQPAVTLIIPSAQLHKLFLDGFDPGRDLPINIDYVATTIDAVVVLPSRSAYVFLQITISNTHDDPAGGIEHVKQAVGVEVWRCWTKSFVLCSTTEKTALSLVKSIKAKMKEPADPKKLKT
ncbi:hypothetical protein Rt10032_c01g0506 [Rhodotorula toruloides]|uniref:Uncharacterized protein n=1 Tax=Rhodotorula toruloides TaxID=5286 RepID=A0A511K812_RHOTO|nr:hypothetical protein Rt10032_c01g0506 [Rhodotorula toruloides]